MAEHSVFTARAVVYYWDANGKAWSPTQVPGFCKLDMYLNPATNAYRIIARGLDDPSQIVINANVTATTPYTKASDTFHQWNDGRQTMWGFNYGTQQEADTFFQGCEDVIGKLKNPQPVAPAATKGPPQTPVQPPSAPSAPKGPPAAPSAPKAPAAPKGGPPKVGGGDAGAGRGALLAGISGFNKGGLKKAETVDKSAPAVPGATPSGGSAPSSGGGSSGGGSAGPPMGGGDMMSEMMAKRAAMAKKNAAREEAQESAPKASPVVNEPQKTAPKANFGPKASAPAKFGGVNSVANNNTPRARAPSSGTPNNNSGGNLSGDMQALKKEIMDEVRAELAQLKTDLIAALK